MQVNIDRLMGSLFELSEIGRRPDGGVCRLSLTPEDKLARDWLITRFKALNLHITVDQIGNVYGVRKGKHDLPAIAIGSHLDTVTTGGRYDGSYGVLAGLEIVQTLNENNVVTEKPLVIINFTNEEGVRFTPDMMGSLALSEPGRLPELWMAPDLKNPKLLLKDELQRIGYMGSSLPGHIDIDHYLELHIEQGPILETENFQIGAVEGVQGIFWTEYVIKGAASHAGTTPVSKRKDAGLIASQVNLFLRELCDTIPAQLCTLGFSEFYPNVINIVPEQVRFVTDLRNPEYKNLQRAQQLLDNFINRITEREKLLVERTEKVRFGPVSFSKELVDSIQLASAELGYSTRRMVSGAGHDAQMMAQICKSAMIFVPSKDGISHNVTEYTPPADIERGANVLLAMTRRLLNSNA